MLCDTEIRDLRPFEPWDEAMLQPASYEVTICEDLKDVHGRTISMTRHEGKLKDVHGRPVSTPQRGEAVMDELAYMIMPDEFLLATTREVISVPDNIVAQVNGKSSLGRLGLLVHVTAGFIDPGFRGQITLELKNLSDRPIRLSYGQKVAQVVFTRMAKSAERPYGSDGLGSHYQNQRGATPAVVMA